MVSDKRASQDTDGVSNVKRRAKQARHNGRKRFYEAMMLFVVIAGLPVVAVPSLRHRLETRAAAISQAIGGDVGPVTVKVGEKQAPFPKEYARNAGLFPGPGQSLPIDRIFTAKKKKSALRPVSPALMTPESSDAGKPAAESSPGEETAEAGVPKPQADNSGLDYTQGEVEQEAYALLLKAYPQVEKMVKGGDPNLRFLKWGAIKRGEDLYWVRLTFQTEENPEVEYIWRVEMGSKQVLPLSYNARSIS